MIENPDRLSTKSSATYTRHESPVLDSSISSIIRWIPAGVHLDLTKITAWDGISFEQNGYNTPLQVLDDEHTVQVDDNGVANIVIRYSETIAAGTGGKYRKASASKAASCLIVPGKSPGIGSPARPTPSAGTRENDDSKKPGAAELRVLAKLTTLGLIPIGFVLMVF
ncbi:hypothetical protein F4814DRAFT_456924 [Daldinia grandis]|nr:hypothetical protein F4814DRAFT_456924 [Daldinia grandis]